MSTPARPGGEELPPLTVAERSRWLARYWWAFSAGAAAVVLAVGLADRAGGLLLGLVGWVVLASVAVGISTSRRVRRRRDSRIHVLTWTAFALVYGAVAVVGAGFPGEVGYWAAAAVAVALPTAVGALVAARRARRALAAAG